jgi:hypothetical protein
LIPVSKSGRSTAALPTPKRKIPELSGAIQCRGVENHMVVNVLPVRHYKGVLALGKAHGKFIAHLF